MPKVITPKSLGTPLGMYSHGMASPAGEIVVVAGQVGIGGDGRVAGDDVGSQTRQALTNVRAVVDAAGCAMTDVVRLQTFLTSADDIPGFMKARGEIFPDLFPQGIYPPNTLVVVSRLVRPEFKVEIEAMAIKRAGGSMRSSSAKRASAAVTRARKSPRGRASATKRR